MLQFNHSSVASNRGGTPSHKQPSHVYVIKLFSSALLVVQVEFRIRSEIDLIGIHIRFLFIYLKKIKDVELKVTLYDVHLNKVSSLKKFFFAKEKM